MGFFHSHKWGKVENDRFQYCTGCGIARVVEYPAVPVPEIPNPCAKGHTDEVFQASTVVVFGQEQDLQVMKCKVCGRLRAFNLTAGQYQADEE